MIRRLMRIGFATLLVGVPAFFLLPAAFPATLDGPPPTDAQGVFRAALSLVESLAMGLGAVTVASAVGQLLRKDTRRAVALRCCLGWILLTLWPMDVLGAHAAGNDAWPLALWLLRTSVVCAALGAAWTAWSLSVSSQRPRRERAGA